MRDMADVGFYEADRPGGGTERAVPLNPRHISATMTMIVAVEPLEHESIVQPKKRAADRLRNRKAALAQLDLETNRYVASFERPVSVDIGDAVETTSGDYTEFNRTVTVVYVEETSPGTFIPESFGHDIPLVASGPFVPGDVSGRMGR